MADITYEVNAKDIEYRIPDSFNTFKDQIDFLINYDYLLFIKDYDVIAIKDRYGMNINNPKIIDLFVNIIIRRLSTNIEFFDDGIRKQLIDAIYKVFSDNKLEEYI